MQPCCVSLFIPPSPLCLCPNPLGWHRMPEPNRGQSSHLTRLLHSILLRSHAAGVWIIFYSCGFKNLNVDLIKSMTTRIPQKFHHHVCVCVSQKGARGWRRGREQCTPAWILHYMCFCLNSHMCVFHSKHSSPRNATGFLLKKKEKKNSPLPPTLPPPWPSCAPAPGLCSSSPSRRFLWNTTPE